MLAVVLFIYIQDKAQDDSFHNLPDGAPGKQVSGKPIQMQSCILFVLLEEQHDFSPYFCTILVDMHNDLFLFFLRIYSSLTFWWSPDPCAPCHVGYIASHCVQRFHGDDGLNANIHRNNHVMRK